MSTWLWNKYRKLIVIFALLFLTKIEKMTICNINIHKNIDLLNNFLQNILCGKQD